MGNYTSLNRDKRNLNHVLKFNRGGYMGIAELHSKLKLSDQQLEHMKKIDLKQSVSSWGEKYCNYFGIVKKEVEIDEILPYAFDMVEFDSIEMFLNDLDDGITNEYFDVEKIHNFIDKESINYKKIVQNHQIARLGKRMKKKDPLLSQELIFYFNSLEIFGNIGLMHNDSFSGQKLNNRQYIFVKKILDVVDNKDKEFFVDNLVMFLLLELEFYRNARKINTFEKIIQDDKYKQNNLIKSKSKHTFYEASTNILHQFVIKTECGIRCVVDCAGFVCGKYADIEEIAFVIENKALGKSKYKQGQVVGEMIAAILYNHEKRKKDKQLKKRDLYHMLLLQPEYTTLSLYSMTISYEDVKKIEKGKQPSNKILLKELKGKKLYDEIIKPDISGYSSERRYYLEIFLYLLCWLRKLAGFKHLYFQDEHPEITPQESDEPLAEEVADKYIFEKFKVKRTNN